MTNRKPKILFAGFAVADIIDGVPYLGGAAGSMSINASVLGIHSSLFAPLSSDKYGQLYLGQLKKSLVDYSLCSLDSPNLPTCLVKDNLGMGSTRDWQDNGALEHFHKMPIPQNLDQQFDAIFLCNLWKDIGEKIASATTTRKLLYIPGPKAVNSPDWISTTILDKTLIIFGNEEESSVIWQSNPFSHGVEIVVTTAGSQGGLVHLKNGEIIPYSAIQVENVVDPTGAGDAWSLGFATEWLTSHDIISSINQGKKLSSECIQNKGAILRYGKT
jgi:sugar/nucleoside kinase (ribokinase family)